MYNGTKIRQFSNKTIPKHHFVQFYLQISFKWSTKVASQKNNHLLCNPKILKIYTSYIANI